MQLSRNQLHLLEALNEFGGSVAYDRLQEAVDVRALRRLRADLRTLRDHRLVEKHRNGSYALTAVGREQLRSLRTSVAA